MERKGRIPGWAILVLLATMVAGAIAFAGGPVVDQLFLAIQGEGTVGLRTISLDSSTRSLCVIDYDHREIHGGFAFTCSSESASLTTGNTFNMLFVVSSSTRYLHIVNQLESTGEGEILFVEAPTISASGTPQPVFNRRRPAARTSPVLAYVNCTFTGGTTLRNFRSGGWENDRRIHSGGLGVDLETLNQLRDPIYRSCLGDLCRTEIRLV